MFDFENLVTIEKENVDQEPATKISNVLKFEVCATEFSSTAKAQDYSKNNALSYNNYISLTEMKANPTKPIWAGSDLYC